MSDIVERLMDYAQNSIAPNSNRSQTERDGAAEITRLRAEIDALTKRHIAYRKASAEEAARTIEHWSAKNERLRKAIQSAEPLIEEASGIADGPKGGSVTDHLDFAMSFLRKALQETGDDQN